MDKIATNETEVTTVRPFDCGTQFQTWTASNCDRCTKAPPDECSWPECPIYAALLNALWDTGYVTEDIAQRMGYTEHKGEYCWPCGEWEPTEAWKAECEKRKWHTPELRKNAVADATGATWDDPDCPPES